MNYSIKTQKALHRLTTYARKTGIEFLAPVGKWNYKAAGISDVRGFSPHRRVVHLGPFAKTDLWVAHDILHILFYDFATHHIGPSAWDTFERFFENHLASEAFAILALDYHLLSFETRGALAVDIRPGLWSKFQSLNPDLPDYLSPLFCKQLTNLYLKNEVEAFALERGKKPTKAYTKWLGHEVRYSEKQRVYVRQWWNDLHGIQGKKKSAVLNSSEVHYGIWELIELLLYSPDKIWNAWVKNLKPERNVFKTFSKFKSNFKPHAGNFDFRYTRITSLKKEVVTNQLARASKPRPENLFLVWQIFSLAPNTRPFSISETRKIKDLAKASQSSRGIKIQEWEDVKLIALYLWKTIDLKTRSESIGDFFLP